MGATSSAVEHFESNRAVRFWIQNRAQPVQLILGKPISMRLCAPAKHAPEFGYGHGTCRAATAHLPCGSCGCFIRKMADVSAAAPRTVIVTSGHVDVVVGLALALTYFGNRYGRQPRELKAY